MVEIGPFCWSHPLKNHLGLKIEVPSGKRLQFANWNMVIEIVSFPINSMVIFHSFLYVYQKVLFCSPWVSPTNVQLDHWMIPWGFSWRDFHCCRQSWYFWGKPSPKNIQTLCRWIISYDSWSFIIQRFNQHFAHILCPHIRHILWKTNVFFERSGVAGREVT